jgi:hypothetical protein
MVLFFRFHTQIPIRISAIYSTFLLFGKAHILSHPLDSLNASLFCVPLISSYSPRIFRDGPAQTEAFLALTVEHALFADALRLSVNEPKRYARVLPLYAAHLKRAGRYDEAAVAFRSCCEGVEIGSSSGSKVSGSDSEVSGSNDTGSDSGISGSDSVISGSGALDEDALAPASAASADLASASSASESASSASDATALYMEECIDCLRQAGDWQAMLFTASLAGYSAQVCVGWNGGVGWE